MTIEVRWNGYSVYSDNIPVALEFGDGGSLRRIKVGHRGWFKANSDKVTVAWTEDEDEVIRNLGPDCPRYAAFPEGWGTYEQKCKWMDQ